MLRSSLPLLFAVSLLSLASTGCAARARASFHAELPAPVVTAQAHAGAAGGVTAQAHAGAAAGASGQAQAGVGLPSASTCSPPPPRPAIGWAPPPVFYGIPLTGAEEVVFVLDHSDSMTEFTTSTPVTTPVAGLALLASRAEQLAQASSPGLFRTAGPTLFQARDSKLEAAKAELISTVSMLPDGTHYNLVFFDTNVAQLSPQLVTMGPVTRLSTIAFIRNLHPNGTTAAVPALRVAYAMKPRRIVFLSDGLANTGGDRGALLAEARGEMRHGVRFDTVGVGPDQDRPLMEALARESGGMNVSR